MRTIFTVLVVMNLAIFEPVKPFLREQSKTTPNRGYSVLVEYDRSTPSEMILLDELSFPKLRKRVGHKI